MFLIVFRRDWIYFSVRMLIDTHNICCFNCAKGLRNDLKAAMDKIDQQYLNEIVGGTESGELDTQHDLKVHEENTTIEELEVQCNVQEKRMNLQLLNCFFLSDKFSDTVCFVFNHFMFVGGVFVLIMKLSPKALGKTLGTGDDDGDQDVIAKFLRVRISCLTFWSKVFINLHKMFWFFRWWKTGAFLSFHCVSIT